MNRRKLFGFLAGAAVAPKALAKTVIKWRPGVYSKPGMAVGSSTTGLYPGIWKPEIMGRTIALFNQLGHALDEKQR